MKLTDPATIKILQSVRSYELEEMIEDYPEDERFGRSDYEMLMSELEYLLECFEDDGCATNEALLEAKRLLRKTKYGKEIPLNFYTLKPMYKDHEIQEAKDLVNEYGRLKRLYGRLTED